MPHDRLLSNLVTKKAICVLLGVLAVSSLMGQQSAKDAAQANVPASLAGIFADGVYKNFFFGFICKVRYGWVDRTQQNREDSAPNGQVLLTVFERPPEVKNEEINSAVLIAAEPLSSFPQVKVAADYFEPLTEATTSRGFKVVNEPYETTVGAKSLVRSDFSKESGKATVYQSSLVMLSKGYAVSFTFIGSSEDEVEQLISKLSFAATAIKR